MESTGEQELSKGTQVDGKDFPCVKVHDTLSVTKKPKVAENSLSKGKAEVQGYETEAKESNCIANAGNAPDVSMLHNQDNEGCFSRKNVCTQTEMLEIPPCLDKRCVNNLMLESNSQRREADINIFEVTETNGAESSAEGRQEHKEMTVLIGNQRGETEDQRRSKGEYLNQGARPKYVLPRTVSITNQREREETYDDGSLESEGVEPAFLARHTEDASIYYFAIGASYSSHYSNFSKVQDTNVTTGERQNSGNQDSQIAQAHSVPRKEKQIKPGDLPAAGEMEITQTANVNSSSTKPFSLEKEILNTMKEAYEKIKELCEQKIKNRVAEREKEEKGLMEEQPNEKAENEGSVEDQNERRIGEVGTFPPDDETKYPVQESAQWLCDHYQRHCKVKFPCCNIYHSCHRCHNSGDGCTNDSAKASDATHLQCTICEAEQPVTESYDTQTCQACGTKLSEYFCPKCKHFTGVEKKPYHCDKCGICRIHEDRSFLVCNVCLEKRLEEKDKCRPDSRQDECCICLEDAFSGCQILPCSYKVHRDCAVAMLRNGIRTCPVCQHPLYKSDDG